MILTLTVLRISQVTIFQNLIVRDSAVSPIGADGIYGSQSAAATSQFQTAHDLPVTGKLDETTASLLLSLHSSDGEIKFYKL